jgi:hypothetical protein
MKQWCPFGSEETFRFSENRATPLPAGKTPRGGLTWARIGHDQALRASLTAWSPPPHPSIAPTAGCATASVSAATEASSSSQLAARNAGNCGGAAGDTEFAVDVLEVLGDGAGADIEAAGDRGVGAAEGDELEDLDLTVGQVG